jgi:hypothetical protein
MATFCAKCGNSGAGEASSCTACGEPFPGTDPLADTRWDIPVVAPEPEPRQRARGTGLASFAVAAAAVLVLAGGSAYALVSSGGSGPARRAAAHPAAAARASRAAKSAPAAAPAPTASAAASPSPAPSPRSTPGGVTVAPGLAADPATAGVVRLLNQYFSAINTRNYAEYSALLDSRMRATESASAFGSGYATTRDFAPALIALSGSGGDEAATISFTSRQSPADSANGSDCTAWTITLYLVPGADGYLITLPPPGYRAAYQDCP